MLWKVSFWTVWNLRGSLPYNSVAGHLKSISWKFELNRTRNRFLKSNKVWEKISECTVFPMTSQAEMATLLRESWPADPAKLHLGQRRWLFLSKCSGRCFEFAAFWWWRSMHMHCSFVRLAEQGYPGTFRERIRLTADAAPFLSSLGRRR